MFVRPNVSKQGVDGAAGVGMDGHRGLHVFVDLGGVDFNVDYFRVFRVAVDVAGHTVVETHADGDQHVGRVRFQVRPVIAVHSEHADVVWMIDGKRR